ncbi:hypothetical protein LMG3458_03800 [Achromobacter deleyi]|uniref:HTH tetR-type domain-containing protein n=2 Tax=Achromobacter deleyi TaxID=1353891 RepID=A0A6S7A8C4_9BURK|nr:hypothetical protein LMG3458_03800 [Achromobacter deleyi]CAB3875973.1 hypothetical protein LMG3481_03007 [Achromobacter deleyi]CAB3883098.1 hypothetical protein LMG3482_03400 [Achromobacter deleyi]
MAQAAGANHHYGFMGHSQADKKASRDRILEAASRQLCEHGLDSVSVGDVMKAAGLTKGAFYAHFESRDALLAEAATRSMQAGQSKLDRLFEGGRVPSLQVLVDVWLDPEHVRNPSAGCGVCALAGEGRHAGAPVQAVIARQFEQNVAQFAAALGGGAQATDRAAAIFTAIVGAVSLARAVGDEALAARILSDVRALVLR